MSHARGLSLHATGSNTPMLGYPPLPPDVERETLDTETEGGDSEVGPVVGSGGRTAVDQLAAVVAHTQVAEESELRDLVGFLRQHQDSLDVVDVRRIDSIAAHVRAGGAPRVSDLDRLRISVYEAMGVSRSYVGLAKLALETLVVPIEQQIDEQRATLRLYMARAAHGVVPHESQASEAIRMMSTQYELSMSTLRHEQLTTSLRRTLHLEHASPGSGEKELRRLLGHRSMAEIIAEQFPPSRDVDRASPARTRRGSIDKRPPDVEVITTTPSPLHPPADPRGRQNDTFDLGRAVGDVVYEIGQWYHRATDALDQTSGPVTIRPEIARDVGERVDGVMRDLEDWFERGLIGQPDMTRPATERP